jgi:pimeloyl-ACP methyl ester carboxylesterase
MAAWPAAFEEAVKETALRQFPEDEFSIYIHGHSTGGPFAMMASQRIANIAGLMGYGSSPFGYMYPLVTGGDGWDFPFNQLRLRTWRDTARYMYEGFKNKAIGLPMLMELTFERWENARKRPNFKAEDFIHKNSLPALEAAARAAAARLKMSNAETAALVQRYLGYTRERSGAGVKPVPPFLSIHGRDDDTVTLQRCRRSLPLFEKLNPPPKVRAVSLGAGVHTWSWTDEKLPQGIVPPVAKLWHDAIMNGFFLA